MKFFCSVVVLSITTLASDAADTEVISKPATGQSDVAIVKAKNDGAGYFFVDARTGERLGDVLGDLKNARINAVKCSWSADGRKVAVFISYGTKLNTVFLYSLGAHHKMNFVKVPHIDPIEIYQKRNPKKDVSYQLDQASGYSENAIGDWETNDTIKIVRGEVKEQDNGTAEHFLVLLEVKIVGDRGEIVKLSALGVLSDDQAERFLKEWKH